MIWFCLIVLTLILSDSYHRRSGVAVACVLGMVALVFLHFWIVGALSPLPFTSGPAGG